MLMNKILRFSFVALMAMMVGNVMAGEATLKYSGSTTGNMLADGSNEAASVGLSDSEWSVTANKGAASNAPGLNKAGDIRLYWHKDGGNTITVSSLKNATINNIAITFTGDSYSNVSVTVGDNEVSCVDGKYAINSTSFVLGNANTSNVQVRISQIDITFGGSAPTETATSIKFSEGYQTQIAKGPDGMFPEIGSSVALPTATVMADGAAVAGANVEWSLEVNSWKEKSEGELPILKDGRISFEGHGVVTVKATYAGNDSYQASSKSYTLTVYNSYGKLSEMVKDIVDINGDKDDEDDKDGSPVFYFFRNIDAEGFPALTSTVTYVNGKYIYLTDGEGYSLLFYGTNTQNLKQGDKISGNVGEANLGGFWGNLKRYKKLPEFVFTDMNVKVESEGNAVEPTTIAADKLVEYINAYVKIENAQLVSVDNKNLVFKVGETDLAVYNQFSVDLKALELGATYTLTGMGSIYNTTKQLNLIEFAKTADAPAGVNTISAAKKNGAIYNLAGQRVQTMSRGLYIKDGKKFIVK